MTNANEFTQIHMRRKKTTKAPDFFGFAVKYDHESYVQDIFQVRHLYEFTEAYKYYTSNNPLYTCIL